jgi:hypothetical protein
MVVKHATVITIFRATTALLAIAMTGWLLYEDLFNPSMAQQSDFLNSCYVAGKICATNSYEVLYPPIDATSQEGSEFAKTAHRLMPLLPERSSPTWQYPPIDAQLFSLFVEMPPSLALMVWQILGITSMVASAYLLSKVVDINWLNSTCLLILFFPFYFTLRFGQQGIVLAVLPICLSLYFFSKQKPVLAGLVGGTTFLTTKHLLLLALICIGLANLNLGMLVGATVAVFSMCGLTLLTAPFATVARWMHNLSLSETYFFDPHLHQRVYLYTSLPPLLILFSPIEYRSLAKVVIYFLAFITTLCGIVLNWRIAKSDLLLTTKVRLIFASAIYLMPIVQPHLLYYDLTLLMPSNILLWSATLPELVHRKLRVLIVSLVLLIDGFFICYVIGDPSRSNTLVFNLILATLIVQILFQINAAVCQTESKGAGVAIEA